MRNKFAIAEPAMRQALAFGLTACLGNPDASIRDGIAFEALSRSRAPIRLARAVLVIAQRKLHSDDEWNAWFMGLMDPAPIQSWDVAFHSEFGIRKRHNLRAFLLSVFPSASTNDDLGVKKLIGPLRDGLTLVS